MMVPNSIEFSETGDVEPHEIISGILAEDVLIDGKYYYLHLEPLYDWSF